MDGMDGVGRGRMHWIKNTKGGDLHNIKTGRPSTPSIQVEVLVLVPYLTS